TNPVAKKMAKDIVLRLNCFPGWYPRASRTLTTTFMTDQAPSRMSTVPRASALVTVVTLFSTARTMRNSQRKLTATLSPTRRRSASNLASIARARTSCQLRDAARPPGLAFTATVYPRQNHRRRLPEIAQRPEIAPSPLFEYTCCNLMVDRFE